MDVTLANRFEHSLKCWTKNERYTLIKKESFCRQAVINHKITLETLNEWGPMNEFE